MRPNDPDAYLEAAKSCFCPPNQDPREALSYLDRAADLARRRGDPEAIRSLQQQRAYYSALAAWVEGDVGWSKAELDRVTAMLSDDNWRIAHAAAGYMTLGQLERAEQLLERVTDTGLRLRWSTWSALLAGNTAAARRLAGAMGEEPPNPLSAIAMLHAGLVERAAQMIARWPAARLVDSALIAQGAI